MHADPCCKRQADWSLHALEPRQLLAGLVVTTIADAGPGSLREALQQANVQPGLDVITFDLGADATINLVSGHLAISDPVHIQGPADVVISVDAGGAGRVFDVTAEAGQVELSNLALTGGDVTSAGLSGSPAETGGLLRSLDPSVTVVLSNLSLTNSAAKNGGAIFVSGPLTVQGSTFAGNTATIGGAIAGTTVHVIDGTFGQNTAEQGGAIFVSAGTLDVQGSTFTFNTASNRGGAILTRANATIANSSFESNSANLFGGAILLEAPAGPLLLNVAGSSFRFNSSLISGGAVRSESGGTFHDNLFEANTVSANGDGGALSLTMPAGAAPSGDPFDVSILASTFLSNVAGEGGGLSLREVDARVSQSRFTGNQAVTGNSANSVGGAIASAEVGRLLIESSELTGNVATDAVNVDGYGGAIFAMNTARLALVNSTVAGNAAAYGGGLYVYAFRTQTAAMFVQSTLTQNTADVDGGGVELVAYNLTAADAARLDVDVANTILSGNLDNSVGAGGAASHDLFKLRYPSGGTVPPGVIGLSWRGGNVVGLNVIEGEPPAGVLETDSPQLMPLGFYGGATRVMPPMPASGLAVGSPAYNGGNDAVAVSPGDDLVVGTSDDAPLEQSQGEFLPRVLYGRVDIGAAEYALPGDANFDGTVNLSDFVILRNHFNQPGGLFAEGDFNGDGKIDLSDFVILRNGFNGSVAII